VSNIILITPPPASSYIVTTALSLCPANTVPSYRSVTAAIPFGPFSNNVTSTSAFIDTGDGVTIVFQAPMGVCGFNLWKVIKVTDSAGGGGKEELILREEAEVTGPTLMMPFVMATEKSSHRELSIAFAKKLGESSD
jgi:hypothetical protein